MVRRGGQGIGTSSSDLPMPQWLCLASLDRTVAPGRAADLRGAGIDAVEQELEGAVRLRAERDLGPEQEHLALAQRGLDHRDAALQVVLSPRPPRTQRFLV